MPPLPPPPPDHAPAARRLGYALRLRREAMPGIRNRQQLAERLEYSSEVVRNVENGVYGARLQRYLTRWEQVFGLDPELQHLWQQVQAEEAQRQRSAPASQGASLDWIDITPGQDDDVRRAAFLKLAAASGLALADTGLRGLKILQDETVLATRRALLIDVPSRALQPSSEEATDPGRLSSLRREIEAAWHLRQASRYAALDNLLPYLIPELELATKHLTGDDQRIAYELLTHSYHAAVGMFKKFGQYDCAAIAADRAMRAAEHTEDRVLLAASAYRLAFVSLVDGRHAEAQEQALVAAAGLEPRLDSPRALAVWGGLVLAAALAASCQGDRHTTGNLLRRAREGGDRLGRDMGDLFTIFGPTVVATYDVKVRLELGDGRGALQQAEHIPIHHLPSELVEQRAHHLIDLARCYAHGRDDAVAVETLRQAERLTPEEIRDHPMVEGLVGELLGRERRSAVPGLRELAGRVGVTS